MPSSSISLFPIQKSAVPFVKHVAANRKRSVANVGFHSRNEDDENEGKESVLEEAKVELIKLCSKMNRGKTAKRSDALRIEALMQKLERAQKDTEKPDTLLAGDWSLLYSSASSKEMEKERERKEGFIGSLVTKWTNSSGSVALEQDFDDDDDASSSSKSLVSNLGNYQNIRLAEGAIENRADVKLFGKIPFSLYIFGTLSRSSETDNDTRPRYEVSFERANIGFVTIPLRWVNACGWIEVTYVDGNLRLGVGDKGSRFVTIRWK